MRYVRAEIILLNQFFFNNVFNTISSDLLPALKSEGIVYIKKDYDKAFPEIVISGHLV